MKQLQAKYVIRFLKDNIEPLNDNVYGPGYRASAYLTDGTFLPCVMFRNPEPRVNLAIKRFNDEQSGKSVFAPSSGMGYPEIVKNFVTGGNRVNDYCIAKVEKSRFALPLDILNQIHGETTMSWTGFAARMKDGKLFGFGTTYQFEFFQMPDGYSAVDIEEIINHSYVLKTGELRHHKVPFFEFPVDYKDAVVYRERPYFECYIDNL